MIIVNTAELAYNLFEKRSSIYSDRCDFPMVKDLYVASSFGCWCVDNGSLPEWDLTGVMPLCAMGRRGVGIAQ
jgi:hypothetical protein